MDEVHGLSQIMFALSVENALQNRNKFGDLQICSC